MSFLLPKLTESKQHQQTVDSIPEEHIVYLGKGSQSPNFAFLQLCELHRDEWKKAIACPSFGYKRSLKEQVCQSLYEEWKSHHNMCTFASPGNKLVLTKEEVIEKLKVKLKNYFESKNLKHFVGVTFPDFVGTSKDLKNIIQGVPLHLPDTILKNKYEKEDLPMGVTHQYIFDRMSTSLKDGGDKEKFRNGNNCFIDGAIYTKLAPNVKVIDPKVEGNANIVLDMVGAQPIPTHIRIRWAAKTSALLQQSKSFVTKLSKVKGNARMHHKSSNSNNFMIAFGEKDNKECYKTNEMFNNIEPKNKTIELLSGLVSELVKNHFYRTENAIKELEKDSGDSYLGTGGHSLDVSINLRNASHFDNGDIGYGVGIWLSHNKSEFSNWYFLLPNTSISGSKGVAIKLYHGLMIEWNGTMVKHCTMDPGDVGDDILVGILFGPKKRFSGENDHVGKKEILVAHPDHLAKYNSVLLHT